MSRKASGMTHLNPEVNYANGFLRHSPNLEYVVCIKYVRIYTAGVRSINSPP